MSQGGGVFRACHEKGCDAQIVWAVMAGGKRMPLNADVDPAGNVAVYRDATGTLVGRVLHKDETPEAYERLHLPHFATCEPYIARQAAGKAERDAKRAREAEQATRASQGTLL